MTTLAKVDVTGAWTLVYDAALSGAFTGLASCLSSDQIIYRVDTAAPAADASGIIAGNHVPVSLASPQRLYARAPDGAATVVLDLNTGLFGMPAGLFEGSRAITVQPYTEANVKNGVEYYLRAAWPESDPIATGTTRKLYFQTGAKKVIVKLRDLHYVGEELAIRLYANPVGVSGGTALAIHNFNNVNPVATSVIDARKNVTTVSDGVEIDGGDPEYLYGASSASQRSQLAIPVGRERIIPANSGFIVAITNTASGGGAAAARVQYFLDWFEGEPDLPL
jgi:hypothetical protein